MRCPAAPACLAAWIFLVAGSAHAQEAKLLAVESAGIVPVTVERRLDVSGITGEISVTGRPTGEIRFRAVAAGEPGRDAPVAVLLDGSTLRLQPAAGAPTEDRRLTIEAPEGLFLTIATRGASVVASGLSGGIEARGEGLDFSGSYLSGGAVFEIDGGKVSLSGSGGEVAARGRDLTFEGSLLSADVFLGIARGRARLSGITGSVEADLEDVALAADGVSSVVTLRARGGTAELKRCNGGATVDVSGTLLQLASSRGSFEVATDTAIRFEGIDGDLRATVGGGSVVGQGVKGAVTIEATAGIPIRLEGVAGPVSVTGTGLTVEMKNVGGEISADLMDSSVSVEKAGAPVTIANDGGEVGVEGATSGVVVRSRGGSVRLGGVAGPVEVAADGPTVEVAWTAAPGEKDSRIENAGGDVTVRFGAGGCRVEAESRRGRIESAIPTIVATEGSGSAQGTVGGARRPTVYVEAEGDVFLDGPGGA